MSETTRALDAATFRETLGHYPTGVVIVTAVDADGQPVGMVVGSFTSVSLDPPLVAYLPTRTSGSYARLRTSSHFCVNILAADQQDLCGRFAGRGEDKFAGVAWRPSAHGAPVLEDAVGWIECETVEEREGGDHMIVLGRVLDLAVERPTLPLLFFQGGYGRFALPSPVAASDPELIESAQLAELLRAPLEELAHAVGADASVMARVGDEAVFVVATEGPRDTACGAPADRARADRLPGSPAVGHRIPLIPPVGTVFCAQAQHEQVEAWLARARGSAADEQAFRDSLATVRRQGFSLSLAPREAVDRVALMSDYSGIDVTPAHQRRIRAMIAESASLYEPDLDPDATHDLHSVIVPVPTDEEQTRLAVRLSRLPRGATLAQVEGWTAALREVAETGAALIRRRRQGATTGV